MKKTEKKRLKFNTEYKGGFILDDFEYCDLCEHPLTDEDIFYEGLCDECGSIDEIKTFEND